jgi:hypothetical protein
VFKLFNSDTAWRGDEVSKAKRAILSSDYDRLGPAQVKLVLGYLSAAGVFRKKRKVREPISRIRSYCRH